MKSMFDLATITGVVVSLMILLLLPGCDDKSIAGSNNPGPTPVYLAEVLGGDTISFPIDTIIRCDSSITITIIENYTMNSESTEPAICFSQFTDRIYWGYNLSILNDVETSMGSIWFKNKGIIIPSIFADTEGPARTKSYFEMG